MNKKTLMFYGALLLVIAIFFVVDNYFYHVPTIGRYIVAAIIIGFAFAHAAIARNSAGKK